METLKTNEIRGYFHYTKSELIDLLIKRRLRPVKYGTNKQEKEKRDIDPKDNLHRQISSNPKKVEIHDFERDNFFLYTSMYKAALALNKNNGVISKYIGKV